MKQLVPIIVLALVLSAPKSGRAAPPPRLENLPRAAQDRGNAFVEAWLALRLDLDSLSWSGAHPGLLDAWLDAMPPYLVRDVTRLAIEPRVVVAAASRLAGNGNRADLALVSELASRASRPEMVRRLRAVAVAGGDRALRGRLHRSLEKGWARERLEAAVTLAFARDRAGLTYLERLLESRDRHWPVAARVLGRVGSRRQDARLEAALRVDPGDPILTAARGEIALARAFPHHHRLLVDRQPGERITEMTEHGSSLYETWLVAVGEAIAKGASTSREVIGALKRSRNRAPAKGGGEVYVRRIKSLINFWEGVDAQLAATSGSPRWPRNFDQAMRLVRARPARNDTRTAQLADRVSAAISICAATGASLGYDDLAGPSPVVRILTPGGGRAADGNLATSWYAKKGDKLILEADEPRRWSSLWLAQACPDGAGSHIEALEIAAIEGSERWSRAPRLDGEFRYFQQIDLGTPALRRLEITVLEIKGSGPGCVAEVRAIGR